MCWAVKRNPDEGEGTPNEAHTGSIVHSSIESRTLANIGFFKNVSAATVTAMERCCRWRDVDSDEVLIYSDEQPDRLFFLLHGELRVSLYTRYGKLLSLPAAFPGAMIGYSGLTKENPNIYTIDAAIPSTLASIGVRAFRDFMQRDPDVLQALLNTMVERQHILLGYIEEFTTFDVRTRIHNELARLCRDSTNADGSAVIFPVPTHERLANRVGSQREAISRELSYLQQTGIIFRRGRTLFVPNVDKLTDGLMPRG